MPSVAAQPASAFAPLCERLEEAESFLRRFPAFVNHALEFKRIAEDLKKPPFVVVMGAFNAGKSTFLNALLGATILKADVLPATAMVTVLKNGNSETVELYGQEPKPRTVPMSRLWELSSEGNVEAAALRNGLSHIEVSLDRKLLQKVTLVDTPGLNSPYESHTRATRAFVDRADAVIWILAYLQPLTDDERNWIESLPKDMGLLVLVNHIDERDPEEESLQEISAHIRNNLDHGKLAVVPLSARQALEGLISGNSDLLVESNWSQFLSAFELEVLTNSLTRRLSRLKARLQKLTDSMVEDLIARASDAENTYAQALGGSEYQAKIKDEHRALLHTLKWLKADRTAAEKVSELATIPEGIADQSSLEQQLEILQSSLRSLLNQQNTVEQLAAQIEERRLKIDASVEQMKRDVEEYNHSGLFGGAPVVFTGGKSKLEARRKVLDAEIDSFNTDLENGRADYDRVVGRFERFEVDCQALLDKVIGAVERACDALVNRSRNTHSEQQAAIRRLAEFSWLKQLATGASASGLLNLDESFLECAISLYDHPPSDAHIDLSSLKLHLDALAQRAWQVETVSALKAAPTVPSARKKAPQPLHSAESSRAKPLIIGFLIALAMFAAIWFSDRKPAQTTPPPLPAPVIGQVKDLRLPQVSLLNPPVLALPPVSGWNAQNIQGAVTFKSENNVQSIVYPNGSQFTLNPELYSAGSQGAAAFKEEFGTIVIESNAMSAQNSQSNWQIQFAVGQAKDINGDGFPEVVLSDYSGGAHCCTTVAVISLRPDGPAIVFSEHLGSAEATFNDLDGDGRREIRYDHLSESVLGTFAQGTIGIPVIYSAGSDGVYRANTRGFMQLISNEYATAQAEYQKAVYDLETGAIEKNRDLINLFIRGYLAGDRDEAFRHLEQLEPLTSGSPTSSNPSAALEDMLQKAAPEVLQEPEWSRIKSGNTGNPLKNTADPAPSPESKVQAPATPTSVRDAAPTSPEQWGQNVTVAPPSGSKARVPVASPIPRQSSSTPSVGASIPSAEEARNRGMGDSISGAYWGTANNLSSRQSASFEVWIQRQQASNIIGCVIVHQPLHGSGRLTGEIRNNSTLTFRVDSPSELIQFDGTQSGPNLAGTYIVLRKSPIASSRFELQKGRFQLEWRTSLPADFNAAYCPGQFMVRQLR